MECQDKQCYKEWKEKFMDDLNTLELLSEVQQFLNVHDYMEDEDVDKALSLVVKLIAKPDVPFKYAPTLIVLLQALSAKFAALSTYYGGPGKKDKDALHKKNMYYTLRDACSKLSDAVKYTSKGVYA